MSKAHSTRTGLLYFIPLRNQKLTRKVNRVHHVSARDPDGILRVGSPKWLERRTFSFTVILETKTTTKFKSKRNYRNPIHVAKEYKRIIDSGQARNESDLARQIGISRVRVNHFISLLRLVPEVIQTIENMGDPMPKRLITERKLRSIVKIPSEKQRAMIKYFI